ncbi:MAG: repair protein RecO [Bacteroidota bacterium]|jgi:DNA repair protein RecO (recombination protein O)
MIVKTKAIVLSSLKYQEKGLITKCFTQQDGVKTYFVPNAFSGKKSNQKIAYFQPLTLIEIEANHKNKGTLEHFKEIKLAFAYQTINNDVYKSTIVIFLSEVLNSCIQEEERNDDLFTFLEAALTWLDTHDEPQNFHLILLLELSKFLGFYPDITDIDLPYFNSVDGNFTLFQGLQCSSEHPTFLLKKLIHLKFDSDQKMFSGIERQILLHLLLDYFALHLDGFRKPKSLDVLKEVFA